MIYADNAATTKLDIDAFEAMKPFLLEEYGNISQPYAFSRAGKKAVKVARDTIAKCIGASPEEIFFTSGGTESNNWVIKGQMVPSDFRPIITSQIEHHAVLNTCKAMERHGIPTVYLPVDNFGIVRPDVLRNHITDDTKMVSIMYANNEVGTVEPISELAKIAHEHGALFHTDAVQAVGHIPIDVQALEVDMLSASGHKFNAPKGVGFLFIRKGTVLFPYTDGGAQEFGMRAGTENVASIVAMAIALEKNCQSMMREQQKLLRMESMLFRKMREAKIDFLHNGYENHIPGNINISIRDADGEMLLHRLDLMGICVSTGSACDSVRTEVSHVIRAMKIPDEYAKGTIRISFGVANHETDAEEVAQALIRILVGK